MAAKLDDETKRLRRMTPGQLADLVGAVKAQAAEIDEQLEALKKEAVRRGLGEAEGELFRITLSAPQLVDRFDRQALEDAMGAEFCSRFLKQVLSGWVMRCNARKVRPQRILSAA